MSRINFYVRKNRCMQDALIYFTLTFGIAVKIPLRILPVKNVFLK